MDGRKTIRCRIRFESYIAHPYWPEREQVIKIQLHSGVNRLKAEDKKEAALKSQCKKEGISLKEYHRLIERAKFQWYRVDSEDLQSPIVIPRHQLAASFVETVSRTPVAVRGKYQVDSFRHHVRVSDFLTDKTTADGVFDRYVKLEGSNKRDHQQNEYLGIDPKTGAGEPFMAEGTFSVPTDTKLEDLKRLADYAFLEIGVGASRKMGSGRGQICEFTEE